MRTVVILLLFANLTFFAYTRLGASADGEAIRLQEQVQPEKIKLLTPQQVAALGPAKVAALADVCLEWGPLSEGERTRALADLEPLALGKLLSQRRIEVGVAYWVFQSPPSNRTEAERRVAELRSRGIADVAVAENGAQRYVVSLGVFRTEDAAQNRAADLAKKGVTNVRTGPRQQNVTQTLLVVRDPQAPVVARMRELVAAYPGSEVKVGSCERP